MRELKYVVCRRYRTPGHGQVIEHYAYRTSTGAWIPFTSECLWQDAEILDRRQVEDKVHELRNPVNPDGKPIDAYAQMIVVIKD